HSWHESEGRVATWRRFEDSRDHGRGAPQEELKMRGFGEIAEKLRRSTVQVYPRGRRGGQASGVIWASGGVILTNAHVARENEAEIELWDGRRFSARVTSRHGRRDLAALRVEAPQLDAASVGDSGALRPGELVIAIGNPLGFAGALSTGVVH